MRISVVGNCQAEAVANVLRQTLRGPQPDAEIRYLASYAAASPHDLAFLTSSGIVLEQVTDRPSKVLAEALNAGSARRVCIPLLSCNFLYPFSNRPHPRAKSTVSKAFPNGCYESQLSDSMLIDLMATNPGATADELASMYLALDYAERLPLDDLFELNRQKNERAGAISGLNLWPRIESLFRYEPVFWTTLHPARSLMRPLCAFALEALDIGLTSTEIAAAAAAIEDHRCAHMPVHASIARHFGIEWATPDYRYRFLQEGSFTAREFAIRFINFEYDGELLEAVDRLYASQDPGIPVQMLSELLLKHPNSSELYSVLAGGFARMGDVPQSLAAAITALEIDDDNREIIPLVCKLVRLLLPQTAFPIPARDKTLS